MKWHKLSVKSSNLFDVYQSKYGSSSDFGVAQKIMYSNPEISESFKTALCWLNIKEHDSVLDIGINNGYELKILESFYGIELMKKVKFIGFDLIQNSLTEAHATFSDAGYNLKLIKGDIRDFTGRDIISGGIFEMEDDSVDIIIALTSLQSSSLVANFDDFLKHLIRKLNMNGCLFFAIPNCHVAESGKILKGQFNALTQINDDKSAGLFTDMLIDKLTQSGFRFKRIGELYYFLYFYKEAK